jgi:hypothetical protein
MDWILPSGLDPVEPCFKADDRRVKLKTRASDRFWR